MSQLTHLTVSQYLFLHLQRPEYQSGLLELSEGGFYFLGVLEPLRVDGLQLLLLQLVDDLGDLPVGVHQEGQVVIVGEDVTAVQWRPQGLRRPLNKRNLRCSDHVDSSQTNLCRDFLCFNIAIFLYSLQSVPGCIDFSCSDNFCEGQT